MVRVLFWAVMVTAMLVLLTAGLLRWELATPGVSPLFQTADGQPASNRYTTVTSLHGVFATLLMVLTGLWLGKMSVKDGAWLHRVWIWPGLLIAVALVALSGLALFAPAAPATAPGEGIGWVLYPPLNDPATTPAWAIWLHFDPLLVGALSPAGMAMGTTFLLLGGFARIGTKEGFRIWALLGALIALGVAFVYGRMLWMEDPQFGLIIFWLPLTVLLAMLSILLIDDTPGWAAVMALGTLAVIICMVGFMSFGATFLYPDSYTNVANTHTGPALFLWVMLTAGLVSQFRPRRSGWLIWTAPIAITLTTLLAFVPQFQLGSMGMPRRYIDYPDSFAQKNLIASGGSALLVILLLALLVLILRRRSGAEG